MWQMFLEIFKKKNKFPWPCFFGIFFYKKNHQHSELIFAPKKTKNHSFQDSCPKKKEKKVPQKRNNNTRGQKKSPWKPPQGDATQAPSGRFSFATL